MRTKLAGVTPEAITRDALGGDAITAKEIKASGNGAAIGGIKLSTAKGWIAARPSGTEDIYKIYAESFVSPAHLKAPSGRCGADRPGLVSARPTGDIVIFDDERILHGRAAFSGTSDRLLKGCYADRDDLLAALKRLRHRPAS